MQISSEEATNYTAITVHDNDLAVTYLMQILTNVVVRDVEPLKDFAKDLLTALTLANPKKGVQIRFD